MGFVVFINKLIKIGRITEYKVKRVYDVVKKNSLTKSSLTEQTSADKDSESPDSSVLALSGRTDSRQSFFEKSGQNPDSGQNRDRQSPDRQTPDNFISQNPDRILTPDRIETDKIRTERHRKVFFTKIRTDTGQRI